MGKKLDISIVTSLVGAGLEREYLLLRQLLMDNGDYVMGIHYTDMSCELHPSDITIFLEVISPRCLSLSRNNFFAPNCEWYDPRNDRFLPQISKIICKTKDCYDIWCRKVGPEKCVYTSFEARDIYRPEIPREVKFLHVAGKSEYKNTEAVCQAWRQSRLPHINPLPPLTIVARAPVFDHQWTADFRDDNVTRIAHATDDELIQLMNSHQFHLIPSMYEGFGHCIHEALGCGGLVVTTNAAPMNTYDGILRECMVPVSSMTARSLAQLNQVNPQAVAHMVRQAVHIQWTQPERAAELSAQARVAFLANREFFRTRFMELVNNVR